MVRSIISEGEVQTAHQSEQVRTEISLSPHAFTSKVCIYKDQLQQKPSVLNLN